MIKIWCEWDIGEEKLVFKSEESAMKWLETNPYIVNILEEEYDDNDDVEYNVQDLIDDGLISFNKIAVIE